MTKKYSSFKLQQTITENFKRFMNEEEGIPADSVKKWQNLQSKYDISGGSAHSKDERRRKDPDIDTKAVIANKAYVITNKIKQFVELQSEIADILNNSNYLDNYLDLGVVGKPATGETLDLINQAKKDIQAYLKKVR